MDFENYKMNLDPSLKNIVSFSGGKDSLAISLLCLEKEIPISEYVFIDTGWEWSQIYNTIHQFEKYSNRKVTTLTPDPDFNWWMYEKLVTIHFHNGITKEVKGKGFPRFNLRWCTGVKQQLMKHYLRKLGNQYYNFIGICYDEINRIQKLKENEFKIKKYPLIEWKIKEQDSLKICKEHGFDFGNLYDYMDSTSCWCCPLQPYPALFNLYKNFPDLWNKLLEMQSKTWSPFKIGKNVSDPIYVQDIQKKFEKKILKEKELNKQKNNERFWSDLIEIGE